jgi:hypothetical protein
VLTLAALVLFHSGCSKLLPTAPGDEEVQGYAAEELWPAPPAGLAPATKEAAVRSSGYIGPDGGELNFETDNLNLDFIVRDGALSEKVRISVVATMFAYYQGGEVRTGIGFVFKPDGLVFLKPAEIRLKATLLHAEEGDVLKLFWHNPETNRWEVQQKVKVDDSEVDLEFDIYHFSRYAIS